jgi:hypothetical protein
MEYTCEDTNVALQRRLQEDMDTCAFTHFGILESAGVVRPVEPPPAVAVARTARPTVACQEPQQGRMLLFGVLACAVVAALVLARAKPA